MGVGRGGGGGMALGNKGVVICSLIGSATSL